MTAKFKRRGRGPSLARVAHHEAGHAVVAETLNVRVTLATIIPTAGYQGLVTYETTHADPETSILISYAGALAEGHRAGRSIRWATGRRTRRPPELVSFYGAGTDLANVATAAGLDSPWNDRAERRAYCRWLWERARVLVERHWPTIEAVAAALVEHGSLSGEAVRGIRRAVKLGAANGYPMKMRRPQHGGRSCRGHAGGGSGRTVPAPRSLPQTASRRTSAPASGRTH